MRGGRDRNLERAWRRRVRELASSRLSIRAFCAREGVAESAFYFWRRELQRRDAESRANQRESAQMDVDSAKPSRRNSCANRPPRFVPITIGEPVTPQHKMAEPASTGLIELLHPGGIAIRVSSGSDLAGLMPILDLLDGRADESDGRNAAETEPC